MIKLAFNEEILSKHKKFIFGKNKKDKRRIYQKINQAHKKETTKDGKNIYKFILDNFEKIILGNIYELMELKNEYSTLLNLIRSEKNRNKLIEEHKEIFGKEYKYFYRAKEWNAYMYQRELGISICPYCATNFIFLYDSDDGNSRGTIDHFIDKAKYPIFSISIHNLIPSCKVCNSDFKGTKEADIDNNYTPFEENIIEHVTFKRELIYRFEDEISPSLIKDIKNNNKENIDYVSMFLGLNEDFNIKVDYDDAPESISKKIKGNLDLFHIEEIYNAYHKKYIQDSIKKSCIYNYVYRSQLVSSFPIFFKDEEELRLSMIPTIEDDKNFILGKLTRDIIFNETKKFTL